MISYQLFYIHYLLHCKPKVDIVSTDMLLFSIFYKFSVAIIAYRFCLPQFLCLRRFGVSFSCFFFAFSVIFVCFLQLFCVFCCFVDASPRFWSCVPLCCATRAVVYVTFAPPVRLYLVFLRASVRRFLLFFEVAVYFSSLFLLLRRCGSALLWCLLVAGVVSWFCGLLGVWLLRVWLVCVWLLLCFCLCWFCFVLGCPLFCGPPGVGVAPVVFRVWLLFCLCCSWLLFVFWLVVVVVLLCPLFCSWWCCGCSAVLLVVVRACCSSWCWLVHVAPGSCVALLVLLVVVGWVVLLLRCFMILVVLVLVLF